MCHYKQRCAELVASHDFPLVPLRFAHACPCRPRSFGLRDPNGAAACGQKRGVYPDKYVYSKKSLQHGGVLTCFDHMNQLLVTGVRSKTPPFSFQLKQHVIMGKLILESRCENTRSAQVGARASAKSLS